jgi:hypothetical protein
MTTATTVDPLCECPWHVAVHGDRCTNPADTGDGLFVVSPLLCTPCVFGCAP